MEGVSNCYVFKSRLQEYAQKVGLPTPVYETIKEGPSHEPSFKSTVIVNEVRYDSLPGFFNRKAAEQSAAEVALLELAKNQTNNQTITQPVHETGLCKNLLQEYAQKMNYAMPNYQCKKDEAPSRASVFSCTVDVGGILYIGGAARTKREAEIKAARTALLAIQSGESHSSGDQQLTVIPSRKRPAEETSTMPKSKKARIKKKPSQRKSSEDKTDPIKNENVLIEANINPLVEALASANAESVDQEMKSEPITSKAMKNSENGIFVSHCKQETVAGVGSLALNGQGVSENENSTELHDMKTVAAEVMPTTDGVQTQENIQGVSENENSTELHDKKTVAAEVLPTTDEIQMITAQENIQGVSESENSTELHNMKTVPAEVLPTADGVQMITTQENIQQGTDIN